MEYAGASLGALILFGMTVSGLLKKVEKSFRKFPWCHRCGKNMVNLPLPKVLPEEVIKHLDEYRLPKAVVSRYFCPKGDYQLWYIPRFGCIEKAFFLKEAM